MLYILLGFVSIGLPWASFAKVEETGNAKGRLEPKGRSFRLDAPVAGTVTRVHVKAGQTVKAGQILLELDSEMMQNELKRMQEQLKGLQNQAAQFELIRSQLETAARSHRLQNASQEAEQTAQVSQTQQRINANLRSYALLRGKLAQDLNEVNRYKELQRLGVVPQVKVVELERVALETRHVVEQARAELRLSEDELKKQQRGYDRITHSGEIVLQDSARQLKEFRARLIAIDTEITQTQNQIKTLELQLKQRVIRAPADGIVFELPIQRTGAVVQPSQLIAQVAPESSPLILRAQLPSQESGFVKTGMPVKIKFDAYPFQDYGVVQGHLHWIAPDSEPAETAPGQPETFEVEVSLDQTYISGQNRQIRLTPGQTATAEIVVRERRVIDFVLDPLKMLKEDGLKL